MNDTPKKRFTYKLLEPISIAKNGQKVDATEIEISAPSFKNMHERGYIKTIINSTILDKTKDLSSEAIEKAEKIIEQKEEEQDDNDNSVEAAQMMMVIYAYRTPEEINKLFDTFYSLLIKTGKIDGEIITMPLIERIEPEELENLLGEYIVNFMIPSVMRQAKKK